MIDAVVTSRLALALALCAGLARSGDAATASALSKRAVPASTAWKRWVVDRGDVVYPTAVRVIGDRRAVEHPNGLRAERGAATTIRATAAGSPRLVLDLGINTGGWVEIGVTRTDGTPIHLGYAEALQYLTPDGDTGSRTLGQSDDPDGRTDTVAAFAPGAWTSPGIRGAQRWVSLELQGAGMVSIDYVRVRTTHLRATAADFGGHFLSNDRQLNRIWYASAYTFALDSVRDERPGHQGPVVVVDGAKRDRLIWLGDLAIENLIGQYAFRQGAAVIRNSLAAFSCQQLPDFRLVMASDVDVFCPAVPPPPGPSQSPLSLVALPEYTAWWVVAVHDYALHSGDDAFAVAMLPVVRRTFAYFAAHVEGGLFVTPGDITINWHPFDEAAGADTHTNAVWYRALRDAADLERRLGDGAAAAQAFDSQADALRQAMRAQLWDSAAGAFVVNAADPRCNHTQDAQVEAILAGVLDPVAARRALRFIDEHLITEFGVRNGELDDDPYMSDYISPFISSTELLARFELGDAIGALGLMRRLWGHMVDTDPHSTVWEKVALSGDPANYEPNQAPVDPFSDTGAGLTSLAHGWGGGPVPALSGYLLGIRPLTSGYSRWLVAPQPGDVRFAQGEAPSPHGAIVSRWRRGPRDRWFRLTAGGPAGTQGVVAVPLLGVPRAIAMDGRIVWDGTAPVGDARADLDGDAVRVEGLEGTHTFAWSGPQR